MSGPSASGSTAVPESRRAPLADLLDRLDSADRIVLTTHVNADGDGAGTEAALAAWLAGRGKQVRIVNPTPFPEDFRFLLERPELVADAPSPAADHAWQTHDLLLVLDTGEPKRLGRLEKRLEGATCGILDHHPPSEGGIRGPGLIDPGACATGELAYDLLRMAEEREPLTWSRGILEGLYTALVSDTGSFRYANTTPRAHRIAADLVAGGVDPEALYRRIFANVTIERLQLLRVALEELNTDPELPLTWISVPYAAGAELDASPHDFEGILEQARSVRGTEIAVFFREVADGSTKVSLRSNGAADVSAIARLFGGGGHVKAAGAVIGAPLAEAAPRVLEAARRELRRLEAPSAEG